MNIRTNLLRLLGVTAIAATASTMIAPVAANAASSVCTQGVAQTVVGGVRVAVTDSTSLFADACVRVSGISRTGNTVNFTRSIRDTARDGHYAVGLARLLLPGNVYSAPVDVTGRSGVEDWVSLGQYSVWMPNGATPIGIQFIACRARTADPATSSTKDCLYGQTIPV